MIVIPPKDLTTSMLDKLHVGSSCTKIDTLVGRAPEDYEY